MRGIHIGTPSGEFFWANQYNGNTAPRPALFVPDANSRELELYGLSRWGFVKSSWSTAETAFERTASLTDKNKDLCGIKTSAGWSLTRSDRGYTIHAPKGSLLAKYDYSFSASVITRTHGADMLLKYGMKYVAMGDANSIALSSFVAKLPNGSIMHMFPFILRNRDGNYQIYKYLPRYFTDRDFDPNSANTFQALCGARAGISVDLFLELCEKQTFADYYGQDIACVPGNASP